MSSRNSQELEIDVIDFSHWWDLIRANFKIIFVVGLVVAILCAVYAVIKRPVYETMTVISPVQRTELAGLMSFEALGFLPFGERGLEPEDIHRLLVFDLESGAALRAFYERSDVSSYFNPTGKTLDMVWSSYRNSFQYVVDYPTEGSISLSVALADRSRSISFSEDFIDLLFARAEQELLGTYRGALKRRRAELELEILLEEGSQTLESELNALQEAYEIADRLNIREPLSSKEFVVNTEYDLSIDQLRRLYSFGTIALDAEIRVLEARLKRGHASEKLQSLKSNLLLLNSHELEVESFTVGRLLTNPLVSTSSSWIKKSLFVLFGFMIGSLSSAFFVVFIGTVPRDR